MSVLRSETRRRRRKSKEEKADHEKQVNEDLLESMTRRKRRVKRSRLK